MRYSIVFATLAASAMATPYINVEVSEPSDMVEIERSNNHHMRHGNRRDRSHERRHRGWFSSLFSGSDEEEAESNRRNHRRGRRNNRMGSNDEEFSPSNLIDSIFGSDYECVLQGDSKHQENRNADTCCQEIGGETYDVSGRCIIRDAFQNPREDWRDCAMEQRGSDFADCYFREQREVEDSLARGRHGRHDDEDTEDRRNRGRRSRGRSDEDDEEDENRRRRNRSGGRAEDDEADAESRRDNRNRRDRSRGRFDDDDDENRRSRRGRRYDDEDDEDRNRRGRRYDDEDDEDRNRRGNHRHNDNRRHRGNNWDNEDDLMPGEDGQTVLMNHHNNRDNEARCRVRGDASDRQLRRVNRECCRNEADGQVIRQGEQCLVPDHRVKDYERCIREEDNELRGQCENRNERWMEMGENDGNRDHLVCRFEDQIPEQLKQHINLQCCEHAARGRLSQNGQECELNMNMKGKYEQCTQNLGLNPTCQQRDQDGNGQEF